MISERVIEMKIWVLTIKDFADTLGLKADPLDERTNVFCFNNFEEARDELRSTLRTIAHSEGIYDQTLVDHLNEDIENVAYIDGEYDGDCSYETLKVVGNALVEMLDGKDVSLNIEEKEHL